MPRSAPSQCTYPNCAEVTYIGTRCSKHRVKRNQAQDKQYRNREDRRELTAFYQSIQWRRLRQYHITRNPLCALCAQEGLTVVADVVDHIEEIRDNPSRKLDAGNLQSLCHSCHNNKTAEVRKKRNK